MSSVETRYEEFLSELQRLAGPVDANFVMRLLYLERKMAKSLQPTVKPHVALTIKYKEGIDRDTKISTIRTKYGHMCENLKNPNEILSVGYMKINDVLELSSDSDIEKITGKASPII